MFKIENYKNSGWGLSKLAFEKLCEIIKKNKIRNVVEFGSGISTQFLIDIGNLNIISFDNDINYSFKQKKDIKNFKLNIRNLLECNEISYNIMFKDKKINNKFLLPKKSPLSTRQKNNFYEIKKGDLKGKYDLIILDGPNGNGRTLAYLHLIKHVNENTIFLIDDHTHHDINEKFKLIYPQHEILFENISGLTNKWDNGGDFIIYKLK